MARLALGLCLLVLGIHMPLGAASGNELNIRQRMDIGVTRPAQGFALVLSRRAAEDLSVPEPSVTTRMPAAAAAAFCAGVGTAFPDLLLLSRPLTDEERHVCRRAGATVVELPLGRAGLQILRADGSGDLALTRRDLFLALAQDIPAGQGQSLAPNSNRNWSDIADILPERPIRVWGPDLSGVSGEVLRDIVLVPGAREFSGLERLFLSDRDAFRRIAFSVRSDGVYRSGDLPQDLAPEAPDLVISDLTDPAPGQFVAVALDGKMPTPEAIYSLDYPAAWPLTLYVKAEHVPFLEGLDRILGLATAEDMVGPGGEAAALGFLPLPDEARAAARARAETLAQ